jgi:hypothetical protein
MTNLKSHSGNFEAVHGALARTLTDKNKWGERQRPTWAVAHQFLKDEAVYAISTKDSLLGELAGSLPSPGLDGVESAEDGNLH